MKVHGWLITDDLWRILPRWRGGWIRLASLSIQMWILSTYSRVDVEFIVSGGVRSSRVFCESTQKCGAEMTRESFSCFPVIRDHKIRRLLSTQFVISRYYVSVTVKFVLNHGCCFIIPGVEVCSVRCAISDCARDMLKAGCRRWRLVASGGTGEYAAGPGVTTSFGSDRLLMITTFGDTSLPRQ